MKKLIISILLCILITSAVMAQTSFSQEITAFYAYGVAGEDQMLSDDYDGGFYLQKNGYYVNGNFEITSVYEPFFELYMKLNTKSRTGTYYIPLELGYSSPKNFSVDLDCIYAQTEVLNNFIGGDSDYMLHVKAGKYNLDAEDLAISRYGFEHAPSMIKTAGVLNLSLIFNYSLFSLELSSQGLFDEAINRLYDTDGGMDTHGKPLIDEEFAPQYFASAKMLDYNSPFGSFSADISYVYNGAKIYSGHSVGASTRLDLPIIPDILILPMALSAAFHEKNIDTLAETAGDVLSDSNSTDFRNTIRAGFALGMQFFENKGTTLFPPFEVDITIAGSFSYIEHIYRDPLPLFGLCVDSRFTLDKKFYIGGGVIIGTIGDPVWETSEGVTWEDYKKHFIPLENLGYEVYVGLNVGDIGSLSIGFVNNRGLSMNYGLESIEEGMIKHKQPDTEIGELLWQTCSVYIKLTGSIE